MSDYGTENDGGYGVDDYGGGNVTVPAGTPYTPEVIPKAAVPKLEIPQMPPATRAAPPRAPVPPPPPQGLRGLGDLSDAGRCTIRSLAQVIYRFFQEVSTGTTVQSLGTLSVYRALYNAHRSSFISGLPAAYQNLPTTLPAAEWSTPMRQVVANLLAVALGGSHPATATLSSLPPAISGITAWFTSFRNALDPADLPVLRAYLEIPIVSGTPPDQTLARAVVDDLRTCGVVRPPPVPPPPATPPRVNPAPTQQVVPGGQGGAGGTQAPTGGASVITQSSLAVSSGTGSLMTVGLVALVGFGLWKAVNEKPVGAKASGLGVFKHPDLAEKARKAARADAKVAKCVAGVELRGTVSLDELAGPKGTSLAKALAKIDAADANKIEELYWTELDGLKPKICPKDD